MVFTLVVRGTGYFGGPAGSGGDSFDASQTPDGDFSEEVLYVDMTKERGLIQKVMDAMASSRSDIKRGYMRPGEVRGLDEIGVLNDPMKDSLAIQKLGPATYALYRLK